MQPELSGAHFFAGERFGKKIAGTERGYSCPNQHLKN